MSSISHDRRLAIRLKPEHKGVIAQAADLLGLSLSAFTVSTLVDRARQVVSEHASITMNKEDSDRFLAMLDHPRRPNERLKQAKRRHSESVVS